MRRRPIKIPREIRTLIVADVASIGGNATARKWNIPRELVTSALNDSNVREGSVLLLRARLGETPKSNPPSGAPAAA